MRARVLVVTLAPRSRAFMLDGTRSRCELRGHTRRCTRGRPAAAADRAHAAAGRRASRGAVHDAVHDAAHGTGPPYTSSAPDASGDRVAGGVPRLADGSPAQPAHDRGVPGV